MGVRGPIPRRASDRAALGNPRKRAIGAELTAPEGAPPMPAWLSRDAKEEWQRVVSELRDVGTLARTDRAALELYIRCWEDERRARAQLDREGWTVERRNGLAAHPAVSVLSRSIATMVALLRQFGLTPEARLRIGPTREPRAASALAKLLDGEP